uniref:HTH cro/C1-type domain-containing protein n=1 Tax=Salmo trutta TaxID=8032 RepID=A0A673XWP7_SALTR
MPESDWDTVTVLSKKGPTTAQSKLKQVFVLAYLPLYPSLPLSGATGQNKQHMIPKNTAKFDRATGELHHQRLSLEMGKVIQLGRQNQGWTQKDLATVSTFSQTWMNKYKYRKSNSFFIPVMDRLLVYLFRKALKKTDNWILQIWKGYPQQPNHGKD